MFLELTSTPEVQLKNIVKTLKKANFEPGEAKLAVSAHNRYLWKRTNKKV